MSIRNIALVLFFLAIVLISPGSMSAQEEQLTEKSNHALPLDKEKWAEISRKTDYSEHFKEVKPRKEKPAKELKKKQALSFKDLFRPILYVLIIGALAIAIFIILKRFLKFFDERVPLSKLSDIVENLEEQLQRADFDALIEKALAEKQYRLAIRILYLKVIKQLSDQSLIHWKKNKTNGHYVREMARYDSGGKFAFLTLVYEQCWFGNYQVDQANFSLLSHAFYRFIEQPK